MNPHEYPTNCFINFILTKKIIHDKFMVNSMVIFVRKEHESSRIFHELFHKFYSH